MCGRRWEEQGLQPVLVVRRQALEEQVEIVFNFLLPGVLVRARLHIVQARAKVVGIAEQQPRSRAEWDRGRKRTSEWIAQEQHATRYSVRLHRKAGVGATRRTSEVGGEVDHGGR